jgi:hypothetical protein
LAFAVLILLATAASLVAADRPNGIGLYFSTLSTAVFLPVVLKSVKLHLQAALSLSSTSRLR